jgi:hypothetical protein
MTWERACLRDPASCTSTNWNSRGAGTMMASAGILGGPSPGPAVTIVNSCPIALLGERPEEGVVSTITAGDWKSELTRFRDVRLGRSGRRTLHVWTLLYRLPIVWFPVGPNK